MALGSRGSNRMSGSIWPGFVDAMTALLLVLMFVLTIFMVVQFVLRETISGQAHELDALNAQIADLADALGLERSRADQLGNEVGTLTTTLDTLRGEAEAQAALVASLSAQIAAKDSALATAQGRITDFESQVAALIAERDSARGEGERLAASVDELEKARTELMTQQEALNLALARARDEVDAQTEVARLAAARREALEAMIAELKTAAADRETSLAAALARLDASDAVANRLTAQVSALEQTLSDAEARRLEEAAAAEALRQRLAGAQAELTDAEAAKLAEVAAAEALREKLKNAQDELTAMTLALEEQRKRAEETLTLLAGAEAARQDLDTKLAAALLESETLRQTVGSEEELRAQLAAALAAKLAAEQGQTAAMTEAESRAALLATANQALAREEAASAEAKRKMALLNEQIAALRAQLGQLQQILDASDQRDADSQVQIEALGSRLNTALAQVAADERRRAELEEAERKRLEEEAKRLSAEAKDLETYKSEFFGKLRTVLGDREGVRVVGDRFVFSSEVLFDVGKADLSPGGEAQIARVASILAEVAGEIPPEINWVVRVDGHTDKKPLAGTGDFKDNWELSTARALSVVHYMIDALGFPPERLAATGFGEFQPVDPGDSPEALAANRRIELKLTEK